LFCLIFLNSCGIIIKGYFEIRYDMSAGIGSLLVPSESRCAEILRFQAFSEMETGFKSHLPHSSFNRETLVFTGFPDFRFIQKFGSL